MVSAGFQMLGAALGIIGWIGVIVVCALPQWKVTAFISENIMTQNVLEGMWKVCVVQSRGQIQCKVYDSMLDPPQLLHAARAPIIISIMMGLVGILLAVIGGKCVEDERAKSGIGVGLGVVFIIVCVLCLIPVCWSANTIIRHPLQTRSQKMELGATLYIGWGAAALMIMGGGFLCTNCPCKEDNYPTKPSAPKDYV
uniref:Claudin a n=1 Tax=Hucho hucho TaxID=62062 RepID=A0A4W5P2T7_9TELE